MDARDHRPDPEKMLRRARSEEAEAARGRLKLFFGAAPGVGKTYAMLEAARARKREGWDVLIGVVETHGRAETAALLDGLEALPRREVEHGGVRLAEFDLDGALRRRPRLIVVDELAHTNAPGSRHAKRWQDVAELLDAGVDVYTTLNVQHWESLNDVVTGITGVRVRETVPDAFLEAAHEIELVDIAPDDLLRRLKEGRIYAGPTADRAAGGFFRPGNLIALRELALRHAAEQVDAQMRRWRADNSVHGVWAVGERLLVGVSGAPVAPRLVRATARMAARLRAPWVAVLVETPRLAAGPAAERARAAATLALAASLGAETVTVPGHDVTEELLAAARDRNVTQIVLGRPAHPRWRDRLFGSVVDDMARRCGDIHLHVISSQEAPSEAMPPAPAATGERGIAAAAVSVAIATAVCWPLSRVFDRVNLVMVYLLAVALAARRFGRRAAFWSSVLGVLAFDFFHVPPALTFAVSDIQYLFTFAILLTVGLVIGDMTARLGGQAAALRERARRLDALYRLSHDLSCATAAADLLERAAAHVAAFLGRPAFLLTPDEHGALTLSACAPASTEWGADETAVARWAYDHDRPAGAGSASLSGAAALHVPMTTPRGPAGVMAVRPRDAADAATLTTPEAMQTLRVFAAEIGGALESTLMSEAIGRAEAQLVRHAVEGAPPVGAEALAGALEGRAAVRLPDGAETAAVVRALVQALAPPNPVRTIEAVMQREKAGPTILNDGVRVPHARLPDIDRIRAVLGVSSDGIWLLFVSPAADPRAHLAFLAVVAAFFRDPRNAKAIKDDPAGAVARITRHQA